MNAVQKTLGRWRDRPDLNAEHNRNRIADAVVREILPRVLEWLANSGGSPTDGEAVEVETDIREMLEDCVHERDGYALANWLDDEKGYAPDSELVAILDDVEHEEWFAGRAIIREWAAGWEPTFETRDRVAFTRFRCSQLNERFPDGLANGVVVRILPDTAQYVICVEGINLGSEGGYCIDAETVFSIPTKSGPV